jgi:hypothetical protein
LARADLLHDGVLRKRSSYDRGDFMSSFPALIHWRRIR